MYVKDFKVGTRVQYLHEGADNNGLCGVVDSRECHDGSVPVTWDYGGKSAELPHRLRVIASGHDKITDLAKEVCEANLRTKRARIAWTEADRAAKDAAKEYHAARDFLRKAKEALDKDTEE